MTNVSAEGGVVEQCFFRPASLQTRARLLPPLALLISRMHAPQVISRPNFPLLQLIPLGSTDQKPSSRTTRLTHERESVSLACLFLLFLLSPGSSSLASSASVNKLLSVLLCNNLISLATCSKIHLLAITERTHWFAMESRAVYNLFSVVRDSLPPFSSRRFSLESTSNVPSVNRFTQL